jgi:hypothetical protein
MFAAVTGCAFGQHHDFASQTPQLMQGEAITLALAVQDSRPGVAAGLIPADFTGVSRGGFGNPFNVTTASGRPLAADFAESIQRGLQAVGYRVTVVAVEPRARDQTVDHALLRVGAMRGLVIEIVDWHSDTLQGTWLRYGLRARVLDPACRVLGRADVEGEDVVANEPGAGAAKRLAAAYRVRIRRLLATDSIVRALRTSDGVAPNTPPRPGRDEPPPDTSGEHDQASGEDR